MAFGYVIIRSPHTPYSIYLRGTIGAMKSVPESHKEVLLGCTYLNPKPYLLLDSLLRSVPCRSGFRRRWVSWRSKDEDVWGLGLRI